MSRYKMFQSNILLMPSRIVNENSNVNLHTWPNWFLVALFNNRGHYLITD